MKKCFTLILALLCTSAFGQFKNLSVSVGSNFNFIPTNSTVEITEDHFPAVIDYTSYQQYKITKSYKGKAGITASLSYNVPVSKRFYLASGFGFDYFRYQANTEITRMNINNIDITELNIEVVVGNPIGQFYGYQIDDPSLEPGSIKFQDQNNENGQSKSEEINTYYLSMPVLIGTNLLKDRLQIEAGINLTALMRVVSNKTGYTFSIEEGTAPNPWNADQTITTRNVVVNEYTYKDSSKDGFEKLQLSTVLKTTYYITKRFGVTVSGQLFLTSIYSDTTSKQKTLAAGLRYRF